MSEANERRKLDRRLVFSQGKVRIGANTWVPVTITDITTSGCRIEAKEGLGLDAQEVWLKIENLSSIKAMIKWVLPTALGIEFVEPLHPAVVDHLVHDLESAREPGSMVMVDKFGRALPGLGKTRRTMRSC